MASLQRCQLFATAETQYAIRSEGAFEYQYANDLGWYGGPGAYLIRSDDSTLSLQAIVSGDTKGKDTAPGWVTQAKPVFTSARRLISPGAMKSVPSWARIYR